MKTIELKLRNPKDQIVGTKLPEVPKLVQQYLDIEDKKYQPEGTFFKVELDGDSIDNKGHGMSYLCEMKLYAKKGEVWEQVWTTGMRQWRSGFASGQDNKDFNLMSPTILSETEDSVTFAYRTGAGNVKVHSYSKMGGVNQIERFSIADYSDTKELLESAEKAHNESQSFLDYVGNTNDLKGRWQAPYKAHNDEKLVCFNESGQKLNRSTMSKEELAERAYIMVGLVDHPDRDYDAISSYYRILIWVKGRGYALTEGFRTGLHHPSSRFYRIGLGIDFEISFLGAGRLVVYTKVGNQNQQWYERTFFSLSWEEEASRFQKEATAAMTTSLYRFLGNHPAYKPNKITEKIILEDQETACWILFEQIDTDRGSGAGGGWLGDQFRYSLWVKHGDTDAQQIYEDHAYIRRPEDGKSSLTGTRGVNCILKDLKLENGTITVQHTVGKVEEESWEMLSFALVTQ